MLVSDITDELAEGSGMTPFDIKTACRAMLTNAITDEAGSHFKAKHILSTTDSLGQSPLKKIFYSIGRSYQPVPAVANPLPHSSNTTMRNSREELMNNKFLDKMEKHLALVVQDTTLISYLHRHFEFDFLLFINQVDFIQTADALTKAAGAGERWLRIHYTILDAGGQQATGGVARCTFPKEKNDILELAVHEFPKCAEQIWLRLLALTTPAQASE